MRAPTILRTPLRLLDDAALWITASIGMFGRTLCDVVRSDIRGHFQSNRHLRDHRYSLARRFMAWATRHPVLVLVLIALVYVEVAAATWLQVTGGPAVPVGVKDDFFRDFHSINLTLLGAQAGFVGLVFPLVIAFVSLMNQGLTALGPRLNVFFHETAAVYVGGSALLFCVTCVVQLPFAGLVPVRVLAATTALNCVWLIANIGALAFFLFNSIRFVQPALRMRMFRSYLANVAWRNELTLLLIENRWSNAGHYDYLPKSDDVERVPGRHATVSYSPYFASDKPAVTRRFQRPHRIVDVRFGVLRPVVRAWLRRWPAPVGNARPPNLTFSAQPNVTYRGKVVLAQSTAPLRNVESHFIQSAFVLRAAPLDDSPESETAELLKELIADLLALMSQGRLNEFEVQLNAIADMHSFLLQAAQEANGGINLGQLQIFMSRNLAQTWVSQYRDLHRRATERIVDEPEYFARCAYSALRVYDGARDVVPAKELGSVVGQLDGLTYHLLTWAASKFRDNQGKPGNPGTAFVLDATAAEPYSRAWRNYVPAWERALSIFVPDEDEVRTWTTYATLLERPRDHLRKTLQLVGRAVWQGDLTATQWSSDLLLKWGQEAERALGLNQDDGQGWYLKAETITTELLSRPWDEVLELPLTHFEDKPTPRAVFHAAFKNFFRDGIVALSALLVHWAIKHGATGTASLAARMLTRDEPFDAGSADHRDLGPVDTDTAFITLLRVAGERATASAGYSGEFEHLAEVLEHLGDAPLVSMRMYSGVGRATFSGLHVEHWLLLMAGLRALDKANLSDEARRLLLSGDDAAKRRRIEYLQRLSAAHANLSDAQHGAVLQAILPTDNAQLAFATRATTVQHLVTDALSLLQGHRLQELKVAPIDEARLESVSIAASRLAFARATANFPIPLFEHIEVTSEPLEQFTVKAGDRERGQFTKPLMAYTPDDDWWSQVMEEQVASVVSFDVRRRVTFLEIDGGTPETFWSAVKAGADVIVNEGKTPILIVAGTFQPRWLSNWRWLPHQDDSRTPDDLVVEQRKDQPDGYQFHLNEIAVFTGSVKAGTAQLLARETFERLRFHSFPNGQTVAVSWEEHPSDPESGTLLLAYQREVTLRFGSAFVITFTPTGPNDDL